MEQLRGKSILITGGASGIGKACVDAYKREGAEHVFIMDINPSALDAVKNEDPSVCTVLIGDVSKEQDVKNAIDAALKKMGKIDVIHNNAGISHPSKSLDQTTEEEWDRVMSTNLKSILWTTKHGIESLKLTKGCMLNTSSMTAEMGQEQHAVYTASKGGINALTKSMALDYSVYNIRVNAISPAGVWTPLLKQWASEQEDPSAIEDYLNKIHVLGYCPEADVIADAAVFLISDAARFMTGCILPVSGGAELGYKVNL